MCAIFLFIFTGKRQKIRSSVWLDYGIVPCIYNSILTVIRVTPLTAFLLLKKECFLTPRYIGLAFSANR